VRVARPGHRVHDRQSRDHVVLEFDADVEVLVGRAHLDDIATDAELAARQVEIGALVLDRNEPVEQLASPQRMPGARLDAHAAPVLGRAEAVQTRHARDDDHVLALEQHRSRLQPEAVDVIVDARVLGDVRVRGRDVRLGLVVVVVADEVADTVLGEELLELPVQLRGERLVRRDDQRRTLPIARSRWRSCRSCRSR
jgi:hypothetical protein